MTDELPVVSRGMVWREVFIATLRVSGNVRAACERAGVSREAAYKARRSSRRFWEQWDSALADAVDALAEEAHRRAMSHSDTLMIYLLKIHGGDYWRRDQASHVDVAQEVHEALQWLGREEGLSDEQIQEAMAEAERMLASRDRPRDSHQRG